MIYQVQIPIGNMPINLVLVGNQTHGSLVYIRVSSFAPIFDQGGIGDVSGYFDNESFAFTKGNEMKEFFYNTVYEYKKVPLMLQWLKQQRLPEPTNVVFG